MEQRRAFLKKTVLAGAGSLLFPPVLNASKLLANKDKARHVIVIVLRGVGKEESWMDEGYRCMPNLFGSPNISSKLHFTPSTTYPIQNKIIFSSFMHKGEDIDHTSGLNSLCRKVTDGPATDFLGSEFLSSTTKDNDTVASYFDLPVDDVTNDLRALYDAAMHYKNERPSIMPIVLCDTDTAHYNYSAYCENLYKIDKAIAMLWDHIQQYDGGPETLLVVATDHGRNSEHNSIIDENGFGGKDHNNESARQGFCVMIGNSKVIGESKWVTAEIDSTNLLPAVKNLFQPQLLISLC